MIVGGGSCNCSCSCKNGGLGNPYRGFVYRSGGTVNTFH